MEESNKNSAQISNRLLDALFNQYQQVRKDIIAFTERFDNFARDFPIGYHTNPSTLKIIRMVTNKIPPQKDNQHKIGDVNQNLATNLQNSYKNYHLC